ncbi:MAG: hypothetical protein JWR18_2895 [Segetibacter sp.]|jgi:hypothetical protein|nr:hypothetical protein [Segetibacter sp.]
MKQLPGYVGFKIGSLFITLIWIAERISVVIKENGQQGNCQYKQ